MEDREIVALFYRRDEQAIEQAAHKYGARCRKIIQNILPQSSDGEEVLNDVYLRAWNSIPPQKPVFLGAYLSQIARNGALNRYKAQFAEKRQGDAFAASLEELDECTPSGFSVEDLHTQKELTALLNDFLRKQPAETRKMFLRRYFYGDSISAVAQAFGCSEGRVKSILMRTRARLRTRLEQEGYYEK